MSGYQETLTDPSYHRQVVVATAPHIGNTGWNDEDDESGRIWVAGYVVRDAARVPSSWRSRRSLDDELAAQGIVGMCDVDTRALTRHLRERGAMRVGRVQRRDRPGGAARAGPRARRDVRRPPGRRGEHRPRPYVVRPQRRERASPVVAVDLGIKSMTPYRMAERGIEVHVLPATASFAEIAGAATRTGCSSPTAPATRRPTDAAVERAARGAGRGHAVLRDLLRQPAVRPRARLRHLQARLRPPRHQPARDGPDHPQGRDHRPQPRLRRRRAARAARRRRRTASRRSATSASTTTWSRAWSCATPTGSCSAFSVQYHPEAAAGPHDATYLFDRFVDLMDAADIARPSSGRPPDAAPHRHLHRSW